MLQAKSLMRVVINKCFPQGPSGILKVMITPHGSPYLLLPSLLMIINLIGTVHFGYEASDIIHIG